MSCGAETEQSFIFSERGEVRVTFLRLVDNTDLMVLRLFLIEFILPSVSQGLE